MEREYTAYYIEVETGPYIADKKQLMERNILITSPVFG